MNQYYNKYRIWIKVIAISVACLFLFNTVTWAYPDRMKLAVQSIFNPLAGVEVRDIGIIKYYSLCLAKNFEGFESIPGDVNAAISNENINITFEFSRKNEEELTALLRAEEEYIIPCTINGLSYYAYITLGENSEISQITIFTEKEFKDIQAKGSITHRKRTSKEEKEITHEQEYDTPLSVIHSDKFGLKLLINGVKDEVIQFFMDFGADPSGDFIREAREFLQQYDSVTLIPRINLFIVKIGRKQHYIPIEMDKPHASNKYINIPQDTYDDIVQVLAHELAVKCGLPHSFNEKIDTAYENWRDSERIINLPKEYPEISKVISTMRFKDLTEVEDRDLSAKGEGHEDKAPPAEVPDKTPRVISPKLIVIIGSIVVGVIAALQFVPPIPLANMLKFISIPGFMNHTNLSKILGFVTFMTMGEICGQYINLRNEGNFKPNLKRDFNWATIGMVFFLVSVVFSWFLPLTFATWTSSLPNLLTGVADQLVSATFSTLIIFPLHGLITGLMEKRFTGKRKLSVFKDICREKLFLFREVAIRSFPYWITGFAILFSLPIGLTAKTIFVGGLLPPFAIYMFYLVNKRAAGGEPGKMRERPGMVFPLSVLYKLVSYIYDKWTYTEKPMRMKRWAKILLPLAVFYNLAYFSFHVSIPTLLIGVLLYFPTLFLGFKEVTEKKPRVISHDLIIMMGTVIAVIFMALQTFVPELPLAGFIPVGIIQKLLAHTDLRILLGFVIFIPMGDIYGQFIKLRVEENFEPDLKRDINWVTVATVFLLTAVVLSWFFPLTYSWWMGSLPFKWLGVADQVFTAPIAIPAIFLVHGVVKKLFSVDKDRRGGSSMFRDLLRERSLELWKTLLLALPYWGIGLGIIFSLPLSVPVRTVIVGVMEPPFYVYTFYMTNKSPDQDKKLKMKTWAKVVLPAALAYNIFYFPRHISLPVLLIGAVVYIPTLFWGFKEVPDEEPPPQSPEPHVPPEPVAAHPDTRNFKPDGSPTDYLAAVGRHEQLQAAHVISDYKEKVKPEVSDTTIRRDRKKLEERGHLKKGPYRYRKGYEYSLTEEGRERLKLIERYEERAKTATGNFSCAMIDLVLSLENGEKVLLALDENLGREGTERLVRTLLKDISKMKDDEKLKTILQNLIIIKGRGEKLADEVLEYTEAGKDGIKVKMSNVIMITEDSNKEKCQGFEQEAIITYVDDSRIDMMGYYPMVEVTLFTLAKALHYRGVSKYDAGKLISLYRSVNVEELSEGQIQTLYIDKKVVTIILKPAEPFEYDELHHIYKTISTFLQAA